LKQKRGKKLYHDYVKKVKRINPTHTTGRISDIQLYGIREKNTEVTGKRIKII